MKTTNRGFWPDPDGIWGTFRALYQIFPSERFLTCLLLLAVFPLWYLTLFWFLIQEWRGVLWFEPFERRKEYTRHGKPHQDDEMQASLQ